MNALLLIQRIRCNSVYCDVTSFGLQTLRLRPGQQINWLRGKAPVDEPVCGFTGELCESTCTLTLNLTLNLTPFDALRPDRVCQSNFSYGVCRVA